MSDSSNDFVPTPPASGDNAPASTPAPATNAPTNSSAPTSGMAIAGLICAFLAPLLGLIFSIIGMKDTKDGKKGGRGLALAGLIISIIGMLAGLLWGVFFVIAMISASNEVDDYSYTSSSTSISSDKEIVKGTVGQAVTAEKMELTVSEVKRNYTPESQYYTADTGKEYVAVSVTLKNKGDDSESFSSYDFKVRDSTGTELSYAYVGEVTGELQSGSLAAGGSTSGVMVYEVPAGDSSLVLVYSPSFFGGETAEITL